MPAIESTALCTVPPSVLPVTLADARTSLRVYGDALDGQIGIWVDGIVSVLEHETGQCLMEQTWQVLMSGFPDEIELPHPVMAIESVKYRAQGGAVTDLPEAEYLLVPKRYESKLIPAVDRTWPATAPHPQAVIVTVRCGYGAAPEKTPKNAKLYILAKLADQFDPVTQSEKQTKQSIFIERLLDACRRYQ